MNKKTSIIGKLIRQNISEIDPFAEIILYGSRARGDEKKDSDWDILVLTDYPVDINKERDFRNNLYDLELRTGEPFSIFVYSKKDWITKQKITPFYYNVTQEGIQL
ncbi:MAG: nucleotidyltransferase domain-containing protein [Bacteroidales bacterium]|nr:nucleotidyltransferase domain-containing protein [Bacteroidales bacterium]